MTKIPRTKTTTAAVPQAGLSEAGFFFTLCLHRSGRAVGPPLATPEYSVLGFGLTQTLLHGTARQVQGRPDRERQLRPHCSPHASAARSGGPSAPPPPSPATRRGRTHRAADAGNRRSTRTPARQLLQLWTGCRGHPPHRPIPPRRRQPLAPPRPAVADAAPRAPQRERAEACPSTPLPARLLPGPRRPPGLPAVPGQAGRTGRAAPTHPLRCRPRSLCSPPGRGGGGEGACAFRSALSTRRGHPHPPAACWRPLRFVRGKRFAGAARPGAPAGPRPFPPHPSEDGGGREGCGESAGRGGQRWSRRRPAITGKAAPPPPARLLPALPKRRAGPADCVSQSLAPGSSLPPRHSKGKVRAGSCRPSRSRQHFPRGD